MAALQEPPEALGCNGRMSGFCWKVPETYEWVLEFADGRKAEGMATYGRHANHVRAEVEKGLIEIAFEFGKFPY